MSNKPKPLPIDAIKLLASKMGINFERLGFGLADLYAGYRVELEHSDVTGGDPQTTVKIAVAHLKERPDYYQMLSKLEAGGRLKKGVD
jgi:hypothetical protein